MLNQYLIVFATIILVCILLHKWSTKIGIPVLLAFILVGVIMGWTDEVTIEAYPFVSDICNFALVFIIFYGGFGTRWNSAKPVAVEAGILATLGVIATAALTGLFCHFVLKWEWLMSLLVGAVVSSTDAASVFSILRARKMGLKHGTAPLLEMESGSNDPCAYMLTTIVLGLMGAKGMDVTEVAKMFSQQLILGAGFGVLIAQGALLILKKDTIQGGGLDSLFMLAVAMISYALPNAMGGNGFLSAYIVGIILGNSSFPGRKALVNFFDGITSFMQVVLFYILGLMSNPTQLPKAVLPAVAILLFMTVIARPATVFSMLGFVKDKTSGKRKYDLRDMTFVSFVGLRGAASIVFVATALSERSEFGTSLFDIVFVIVILSIGIQGALIPAVAKKLDMIDIGSDSTETFTDFVDNSEMHFSRIDISGHSTWRDKMVKDLLIPTNMVLVMILRGDEKIVPNGETVIEKGDGVIIGTREYEDTTKSALREHSLRTDKWSGKPLSEYPSKGSVVIMVRRGDKNIIPTGRTILEKGDTLILMDVNK